tara:strand:+ start:144 stop:350 length:207 start_codon:yes stop_codon:yes gene_type:complete
MKNQSILLLLSILIFFALIICNIQKIRGECEKFSELIKKEDLEQLNNMSKIVTRKKFRKTRSIKDVGS